MNARAIGSMLVLMPTFAAAATFRVPADYPTIQAALAVATAGDSVVVACGIYHEHGLVLPPGVTLLSQTRDSTCVTIDGDGLGRVLSCQGPGQTVVQGLTIRGGHSFEGYGGGIYLTSASLALTDCAIDDNFSRPSGDLVFGTGGGIYLAGSSLTVMRCSFARDQTGGHSSNGGAISTESSTVVITDSSFDSNVTGAQSHSAGGALYGHSSSIDLTQCSFRSNYAQYGTGGAIELVGGESEIAFCTFVHNAAAPGGAGSGLAAGGTGTVVSISHCTFASDWFSWNVVEADAGSSIAMKHCLVAFNQGQSVDAYRGGVVALACTDMYGNRVDWPAEIADQQNQNGNLSLDPLFCNLAADDFHLQWGSPCLPQNSSGCDLIGAFSFGGCASVAVEPESWGGLKAKYR
ncbi:MAG: hypothetical protein U0167_14195 [bacterium]